MPYFLNGRKIDFCKSLFANLGTRIVFVDVGSGGPLKAPWTLLPPEHVEKVDFDPEVLPGNEKKLPLCISNKNGNRSFHIACDPRASSLHTPNAEFMDWFDRRDMAVERTIEVRCETIDSYFSECNMQVDLLDINVEGHDLQVLLGSEQLFRESFPKVVKIEFELAEVWKGQGWFSDIDAWMRQHHFELIDLNFECIRPANVRNVFHRGEPVWGKAIYAPAISAWEKRKLIVGSAVFTNDLYKAIGLYTILDAPGRAVDLLNKHADFFGIDRARQLQKEVVSTFRFAALDFVFGLVLRIVRRIFRRF